MPRPSTKAHRPSPRAYHAELHHAGSMEKIADSLPNIIEYAKSMALAGHIDTLYIFTPSGAKFSRTREQLMEE